MSSIDVVCVDSEISLVAKEIQKSLVSLSEYLTQYVEILSYLQEFGIKDELIRKKLFDSAEIFNKYIAILEKTYKNSDKAINNYLKQFKANDKLTFPYNETMAVDTKISFF